MTFLELIHSLGDQLVEERPVTNQAGRLEHNIMLIIMLNGRDLKYSAESRPNLIYARPYLVLVRPSSSAQLHYIPTSGPHGLGPLSVSDEEFYRVNMCWKHNRSGQAMTTQKQCMITPRSASCIRT
ncbi:hypothetical protein ACMFMF_005591 [Clarireedia jacksonii]